MYVQKKIKIIK